MTTQLTPTIALTPPPTITLTRVTSAPTIALTHTIALTPGGATPPAEQHSAAPQPSPATLTQVFNAIEPMLRGDIIKNITATIRRAQGSHLTPWVIAGMEAAITALTEDLAPAPTGTPQNLTAHLEKLGVAPAEVPSTLTHVITETRIRCAKIIAASRTTRRGAEGVFFNMGIDAAITATVGD